MIKYIKYILVKLYYLKSFLRFKSFGSNILLSSGGTIIRPNEIKLGSNIFISRNFHISARNLEFGDNIMIGPNLVIECDNHIYSTPGLILFNNKDERKIGSVKIENDVWIGANVILLAGSIIGEGSIIGAGSLVNKSLPPYSICFGTPCKPVKTRFSPEELKIHISKVGSKFDYNTILSLWIANGLL